MWGDSLDLARRLVEAERGISDDAGTANVGWHREGRTSMATHEQAAEDAAAEDAGPTADDAGTRAGDGS